MSPAVKWRKRISHQIMGFQMSLKGRIVATMLVLSHISNESLWRPEGTVHGPTGRGHHCCGLKLYLGHSVKVIATKVDMGFFIISPNPRSLVKLWMHTEIFRIMIIKETGCWRWAPYLTLNTFECKWFQTGYVCMCFMFIGDFLLSDCQGSIMFIIVYCENIVLTKKS